jgi:ligand-binding sensor domain-containing protein
MKRLLPSLLLILCCALTAHAQTAFHTVINMEEEEGNTLHIKHLARDRTGYLWIGTQEGLYRFDGKNFQRMDADSVSGQSAVTALEMGGDGILRAGFQSGRIGMMEHRRLATFSPQEGMPRKAITAVHAGKDGNLWFAAADEGLYYRVHGKLYNINHDDGLGDDYIYCITDAGDGGVIVGTDRGLSIVRMEGTKKIIRNFATAQGLPDNIVRVIEPADSTGQFWIGMQDKGVCLFDSRTLKMIPSATPWPWGQVNAILPVEGHAWVATEDSGMVRVQVGYRRMYSFAREAFPPLPKVSDLIRDAEGNLWLSQQGRLLRSSAEQLAFFGNGHQPIHALSSQGSDQFWVAESNKVLQYASGTQGTPMKTYRFPGSGLADITSLYVDMHDILWVGTIGAGIIRLDTRSGRWSPLKGNPILVNSHVLSITGKGKEVWISGLNGVAHYSLNGQEQVDDYPSYVNLNKDSGIGSDYVYQVFIDSKDRVWFATDGAGVSWKDATGFHHFGSDAKSSNRVVYSVTEDHEGTIWCNVLGEGLYRFDGQTFRSYRLNMGSLGSEITSITAGPGSTLVLGQKKGISWLDTHSGRLIHFGKSSGMTWTQSNLNAAIEQTEGWIWMGTD